MNTGPVFNQKSPQKKRISVYADPALIEAFKAACDENNIALSDALETLMNWFVFHSKSKELRINK